MLFFILSMRPDRRPHWFGYWLEKVPDDIMVIVEEVRILCAEQNRVYVSLFKFDVKASLLPTCVKLHTQFDEKFRMVVTSRFAAGYMKAFSGITQVTDLDVQLWEQEILAADPLAATLLEVARGFGAICGAADQPNRN